MSELQRGPLGSTVALTIAPLHPELAPQTIYLERRPLPQPPLKQVRPSPQNLTSLLDQARSNLWIRMTTSQSTLNSILASSSYLCSLYIRHTSSQVFGGTQRREHTAGNAAVCAFSPSGLTGAARQYAEGYVVTWMVQCMLNSSPCHSPLCSPPLSVAQLYKFLKLQCSNSVWSLWARASLLFVCA